MKIFAAALLAGISAGSALWYNAGHEKEQNSPQDIRTLLNTGWAEKKIVLPERTPLYTTGKGAQEDSAPKSPVKLPPREGFVLKPGGTAIEGIRVLELSDDELLSLGISRKGGAYEFYTEEKKDGSLLRAKHRIDTFAILSGVQRTTISGGKYSKKTPLALTHQYTGEKPGQYGSAVLIAGEDDGLAREVMNLQDEHEASRWHPDKYRNVVGALSDKYPLMNRLIPVHVPFRKTDPVTGREKILANATFWFAPTEEFVAALPGRYREALTRELALISKIEKKELSAGEACAVIKGEPTFFDLCRTESGAVKDLSVYPNPVEAHSKCVFTLDEARNVTVSLHRIDGSFLRDLVAEAKMLAGPHEISLNFRNVPAGAYLVTVRTGAGDQAVFRVLVP